MLLALTRSVGPALAECALSFHERLPIDVEVAARQHQAYESCLRELGAEVRRAPDQPALPDAVFVEDTAVVVDELAVLTAPLLPARRAEVASMGETLAAYRTVRAIEGDATLEGGDVLRIDRTLYVGISRRTNQAGLSQLAALLEPHGYTILAVAVTGCLHLKSAVTYIGRGTLLANRGWIEMESFAGMRVIEVDPAEPGAANALPIGEMVLLPAAFPRTRAALEAHGYAVRSLDVSELQKAEAGLTCCSILLTV